MLVAEPDRAAHGNACSATASWALRATALAHRAAASNPSSQTGAMSSVAPAISTHASAKRNRTAWLLPMGVCVAGVTAAMVVTA